MNDRLAIGGGTLAAILACLAFASLSGRARAQEGYRSETVTLAGLDLRSERDRRVLDLRIRRAAHLVCTGNGVRELSIVVQEQQCFRETLAAAKARSASLIARNRIASAH